MSKAIVRSVWGPSIALVLLSCSGGSDVGDDDAGCAAGQIEVLPGLCVKPGACPSEDADWESNTLSLPQIEALATAYKAQDVVVLYDADCESVRVGIDARNGRALYSEIECNDLCPDYTQRLLTYGPDVSACADVEACYLEAGAQPGKVLRCLPVLPQGVYGSCYCPSADVRQAGRNEHHRRRLSTHRGLGREWQVRLGRASLGHAAALSEDESDPCFGADLRTRGDAPAFAPKEQHGAELKNHGRGA